MKKKISLLLTACLMTSLFSGVEAKADTEEKTKLRVAVQSYYCSSVVELIQEEGWADDYNLELEYSVFSSGPTINEAMGEWDIAVTGGAFIYAVANYDCKLIAHQIDGTAYNDIVAREGTEIAEAFEEGDNEKLAELVKGTTILTNVGITGHYGLILWLQSLGLTADDVNFVSQDMSTIYASWIAGEGDLALLTFPYDTMVEESVIVGSLESAGGHMYEATVCTKDAYEKHYDAVVDFVKLVYRACDALAADEELAKKTAENWYVNNGKELDQETIYGEVMAKPYITSDQAKSIDLTEFATSYGKYLVEQGLMEADRVDAITENCANDVVTAALSDEVF